MSDVLSMLDPEPSTTEPGYMNPYPDDDVDQVNKRRRANQTVPCNPELNIGLAVDLQSHHILAPVAQGPHLQQQPEGVTHSAAAEMPDTLNTATAAGDSEALMWMNHPPGAEFAQVDSHIYYHLAS